jgi:hypothetical protein
MAEIKKFLVMMLDGKMFCTRAQRVICNEVFWFSRDFSITGSIIVSMEQVLCDGDWTLLCYKVWAQSCLIYIFEVTLRKRCGMFR